MFSFAIFVFKVLIYYLVILLIDMRRNNWHNLIFYESDTTKSAHNRIIRFYRKYVVRNGFDFYFAFYS